MKTVQKIQKDKLFNENLVSQWQTEKIVKFYTKAKCVSSWPAHFKNGQIFRNWPWNGQFGNPGTGGWVQLIAEKEILIVVASIVVQCCVIKKNVIVASQLYDIADEQFTAEKEGPFEHLQFIQKYNLENTVPNIVIMLRIFLTIAVSVATR